MIKSDLFKKKELSFNDSIVNIITFGPGYGESIVVFLPGLGWGVIDSCTVKIKKKTYNPALEYLKSLGVKRLSFVILTHPHLDHYKGLEKIVQHYMGSIDRICYYAGEGLREYRTYLARKNIISEPGLKSLAFILRQFKEAKERGSNIVKISERTEIIRKNTYKGHEIEMLALSPSEDSVRTYCELLHEYIPKNDSSPITNLSDKDHNLVSSAIWCKIDDKIFIFGSDLENGFSKHSGWEGVLNNIDSPELSPCFVKIPHHGSPGAYHDAIWKKFSMKSKPISVVTPYNKSSSPRPDRETLDNISKHSESVFVTSSVKFENPKKLYKEIPIEASYGINSWSYLKYPQQIGYIKALYSPADNSTGEIILKKPAHQFAESE